MTDQLYQSLSTLRRLRFRQILLADADDFSDISNKLKCYMIETRVNTVSFSLIMCKVHHDKRMNESAIKTMNTK